jgi:hypothetical protein
LGLRLGHFFDFIGAGVDGRLALIQALLTPFEPVHGIVQFRMALAQAFGLAAEL